ISQLIAARLIPRIEQVKRIRQHELGERCELVTDILRQRAPSWRWQRPTGGLFIWVQLPGIDTRELAQEALRYNMKITPGTNLSVDETHTDWLRLPFLLPPNELRDGVLRLIQMEEQTRPKATTPTSLEA